MNLKNNVNISKIKNQLKNVNFGYVMRGIAIEAYLTRDYLEKSGEDVRIRDILNRIENHNNSKEQS